MSTEFKRGTIGYYLNMMHEPERSEAIKNGEDSLNDEIAVDTADAIDQAFAWGNTQEGWAYWNNIHAKYKN